MSHRITPASVECRHTGTRSDPEDVKRMGWRGEGILVVDVEDDRLTWPERELVRQLGEKFYGKRKERS